MFTSYPWFSSVWGKKDIFGAVKPSALAWLFFTIILKMCWHNKTNKKTNPYQRICLFFLEVYLSHVCFITYHFTLNDMDCMCYCSISIRVLSNVFLPTICIDDNKSISPLVPKTVGHIQLFKMTYQRRNA